MRSYFFGRAVCCAIFHASINSFHSTNCRHVRSLSNHIADHNRRGTHRPRGPRHECDTRCGHRHDRAVIFRAHVHGPFRVREREEETGACEDSNMGMHMCPHVGTMQEDPSKKVVAQIMHSLERVLDHERDRLDREELEPLVKNKNLARIQSCIRRYLTTNKPVNHRVNWRVLRRVKGDHLNQKMVKAFHLASSFILTGRKFSSCVQKKYSELLDIDASLPFNDVVELLTGLYQDTMPSHRLFIFSSENNRSPLFKTVLRPRHTGHMGIYIDKENVYAIKNLRELYGTHSTFCPDCVSVFQAAYKHRKKCPHRCPSCCRYGYMYPCKDEEQKKCEDCNRVFLNEQCFLAHKRMYRSPGTKAQSKLCDLYKACKNCGENYVVNEKPPHLCGHKYCPWCNSYHKPHEECKLLL